MEVTKRDVLKILAEEYWRHVIRHSKENIGKDDTIRAPWSTELNTAYDLIIKPKQKGKSLKATSSINDLKNYEEHLKEEFPQMILDNILEKERANIIYSRIVAAGRFIASKYGIRSQSVTPSAT